MAKKLTAKEFENIRSGKTIWRVWGYPTFANPNEFVYEVSRFCILGKKIGPNHPVNKKDIKWTSTNADFLVKRFKNLHNFDGYVSTALAAGLCKFTHFRQNMIGVGMFWTKKEAEKYVEEIKLGFHQDVVDQLKVYHRDYIRKLIMNARSCCE